METFISDLSQKAFSVHEKINGSLIRKPIFEYIQKNNSSFKEESILAFSELNYYREKYISEFLATEIGEINSLENKVAASFNEEELLTESLETNELNKLSIGQSIADKVATFGGSWKFIIIFGVFILIWILLNIFWMAKKGFDPYPFILLNLILSCLAALQAPVIMMSQNRQEEKDRERAKKDYLINLKSEFEIRMLHEKIDHIMLHEQQKLLEIQKVQIEMMNDLLMNSKK